MRVDSVDQWKKGLSRDNQPMGLSVCNERNTLFRFFQEKRVDQGVEHVNQLIFQL